ncbi:hypothetical protein BELL_0203g00050 [Botrytis elliptica]|uniref:Uncharacterized protein n=1 Tax=Botrytis elliptica TaxID=278938 RepID=A0A4Z1JP93_9HELO|nr:hypothetical protein BELL_0203g00050 [Botrytis elliptica]
MFSKNPFRRKDSESRKKRDYRDDQTEAPRGGSRAPSRSRDNRRQSDVASQAPRVPNMGYLRRTLKEFACMPGLAEDIGPLLHEVKIKLEKLHEIDGILKGRSKVGINVEKCTEHLVKAQQIHWKIENSIKNEDRELKKGGSVQTEGDATAYEKAFKDANGCSPETWETMRTMGKNEDDLDLVIIRYRQILKSNNCRENEVKEKVVKELISKCMELKATHERAQSILEIDNPQRQSREPRSDTRVPRPNNTRNYTGRDR